MEGPIRPPWIDGIMLATAGSLLVFTLLQLPSLFYQNPLSGVLHVLSLAPLWMILAERIWVAPAVTSAGRQTVTLGLARIREEPWGFLVLGIYVAFLLLALLRAAIGGVVGASEAIVHATTLITVCGLGLAVFVFRSDSEPCWNRLRWVCFGVALCLLLNVALNIMGVVNPVGLADRTEGSSAIMLGLIGIVAERQTFTLASGLNSFGNFAGAGFVFGSIVAVRGSGRRFDRPLGLVAILAGTYVMIASDSRANLLMAVLVSIFAALTRARWLAILKWSVLIAPFLPLLILWPALYLAESGAFESVARSSADVVTANNRSFAWLGVSEELSRFRGIHIVGFGYLGALVSGALADFYLVFGATFDEQRITAHNAVMQYVLDIGYMGTAAFLVVFWNAFRRVGWAARSNAKEDVAPRTLGGLLLYFLLTGSTESSPTMYTPETFTFFLLICVASFSLSLPRGRSALPASEGSLSTPE